MSQGSSWTHEIIKRRRPILHKNEAESIQFQKNIAPLRVDLAVKSWLGVPLFVKDEAIGAIILHNDEKEYCFTDRDINLFKSVSSQIATVIERKQYEEAFFRQQKKLEIYSPELVHF